jgi:hypothetical protein
MRTIVFRCAQCGFPVECETGRIPVYGARVRCAECGSLLPLIVLPPAHELAAQAAPGRPAASRAPFPLDADPRPFILSRP